MLESITVFGESLLCLYQACPCNAALQQCIENSVWNQEPKLLWDVVGVLFVRWFSRITYWYLLYFRRIVWWVQFPSKTTWITIIPSSHHAPSHHPIIYHLSLLSLLHQVLKSQHHHGPILQRFLHVSSRTVWQLTSRGGLWNTSPQPCDEAEVGGWTLK